MSPDQAISRRSVCIACNGECSQGDRARSIAIAADLLVAADGGAVHLSAMGLKPHAIVGDMDSLNVDPWRNDPGIQRIRYPREKDQCDGELAVRWAFENGCDKALLLGAWGGRLDYALGHVALLTRFSGQLALWADDLLVLAARAGQEITLPAEPGGAVSLIAFTEQVRLSTIGLKYALADEPLRYATHGLSNVAVEPRPAVSVSEGAVIVCIQGGESWLTD